jgi:hypothetical protein
MRLYDVTDHRANLQRHFVPAVIGLSPPTRSADSIEQQVHVVLLGGSRVVGANRRSERQL